MSNDDYSRTTFLLPLLEVGRGADSGNESSSGGSGEPAGGPYLRSALNGAINGITATFTIIAASAGARLSVADLASMSLANLLGDGFALGIAEGVSSWVAQRHGAVQYAAVVQRTRTQREELIVEVCSRYSGLKPAAATTTDVPVTVAGRSQTFEERQAIYAALDDEALIALAASYSVTACAVRDVAAAKRSVGGQQQQQQLHSKPFYLGLITTTAFILCGSMAVLALYMGNVVGDSARVFMVPGTGTDADAPLSSNLGFYTSGAVTVLLLFALGAANSRYIHFTWWRSGLLILCGGMPTAVLVFALSKFIEWFVVTQVGSSSGGGDDATAARGGGALEK
jgi:hypothetical protein